MSLAFLWALVRPVWQQTYSRSFFLNFTFQFLITPASRHCLFLRLYSLGEMPLWCWSFLKHLGVLLLPITSNVLFSPAALTKNTTVALCFAFFPPRHGFFFSEGLLGQRFPGSPRLGLIPDIPRWVLWLFPSSCTQYSHLYCLLHRPYFFVRGCADFSISLASHLKPWILSFQAFQQWQVSCPVT